MKRLPINPNYSPEAASLFFKIRTVYLMSKSVFENENDYIVYQGQSNDNLISVEATNFQTAKMVLGLCDDCGFEIDGSNEFSQVISMQKRKEPS